MKLTIRHYFDFGDHASAVGRSLCSVGSWDAIRLSDDASGFSIPPDREKWLAKANANAQLAQRAEALVLWLKRLGIRRLASVGVGTACLEYHIKRLHPSLILTCTDYTPSAIGRLRAVFPECDNVRVFDMLSPEWPTDSGLHLLNRVDTELDDAQWMRVFDCMAKSSVNQVLVVPSEFVTCRVILSEKVRYLLSLAKGRKPTFAGWLRTRDRFLSLWDRWYQVQEHVPLAGLEGFLLTRRSEGDDLSRWMPNQGVQATRCPRA